MTGMEEKGKKVERSIWPYRRNRHPFSLLENIEDDWDLQDFSSPTGLSVSEDDQHVYVEAALPGIRPEEIDMVFEKGVLWIKAEKRDEAEDKKKKYYRKALNTFSYQIAVPGDIDEAKQPEAICKHGVLQVIFSKKTSGPSKKIPIKEG